MGALRDDIEELNPRTIRKLVNAHDFFFDAVESGLLNEEQEMLCLVYHDALCWALGSEASRLPGMLRDIRCVINMARFEQVPAINERVQ